MINKQAIFTATELYAELSDLMDLVTVYRILSVFQENKVIREVCSGGESKKYELACVHNPVHPHFKCRICGALYCVDTIDKNVLDKLKINNNDFIIENISVEFSGICNKCRR